MRKWMAIGLLALGSTMPLLAEKAAYEPCAQPIRAAEVRICGAGACGAPGCGLGEADGCGDCELPQQERMFIKRMLAAEECGTHGGWLE